MKQLLYFSAPWCGPCKSFGPTMDRVASSGIPLSKINIDYDATSPAKYSIKSVPTVVLTENGQEVKRFVGVKSFQEVINFYNG
jgi:thioredoxin 1|tara:strand:- start:326 stop:574 length:249 start_codon:yes stop_codon:yes gene_type:complete